MSEALITMYGKIFTVVGFAVAASARESWSLKSSMGQLKDIARKR